MRLCLVAIVCLAVLGIVFGASPTRNPTRNPTRTPTRKPTAAPSRRPTIRPSIRPTAKPSFLPSSLPTSHPTSRPTAKPTATPTARPTSHPTSKPTSRPSPKPTRAPKVASSGKLSKKQETAIIVGVFVPLTFLVAFGLYFYRRYRDYLQRFVSIPLPYLGPVTADDDSSTHSTHSTAPLTGKKKKFVYGQMRQDDDHADRFTSVTDEENAFEIVRNPIRHRSVSSDRKFSLGDDNDDATVTEEHVSIAGIVKQGYLNKKSTRGSWLKRWFFISDGKLYYSRAPVDSSHYAKGETITAVLVANFMISTFKIIDSIQFQVISPGKRGVGTGGGTYVLKAETEDECSEWIRCIQTQIAGALSLTLAPASSKAQSSVNNVDMFVPSKATLRKLMESNPFCVDCGAVCPDWASLNLGVMMCIDCSGVHRSLGSHISKVRSLKLDKWSKNLLQLLVLLGNEHVNEIWEESLRRVTDPHVPCGPQDPPHQSKQPHPPSSPTKTTVSGVPVPPLQLQRLESDSSSVIVDIHGHQHRVDRDKQEHLRLSARKEMGDKTPTDTSSPPMSPTMSPRSTRENQRTMKPPSLSREVFIQRKYRDRAYILKMAEENDDDVISIRFLRAAHQGNIVELQRAIALGVDINVCTSSILNKTDNNESLSQQQDHQQQNHPHRYKNLHQMLPLNCTALMLATQMGHVLCVELLVQWNVDVQRKRSDTQETALDMARAAGDNDLIAILSR